ncbi:hypothetical protein QCQ60_004951 [Bacillus cereus]|nr:hypothetical protein [Bacillus cereus]
MNQLNQEHGLFVLKPDSIEKGLLNDFLKFVINKKIEIVQVKVLKLNYQQALKHFSSIFNLEEYAAYMSRGQIAAILVRGEKIGKVLGEIKREFRKGFGYTSENMENLVHTADQGNEYYEQFKLLFPELELAKYTKWADMNILVRDNEEEVIKILKELEQGSNLVWAGVVQETGKKCNVIEEFEKEGGKLKTLLGLEHICKHHNDQVSIIAYLPDTLKSTPNHTFLNEQTTAEEYIQWVKMIGGITVLNYKPLTELTKEFLLSLKDIGLDAVHIYDARRSIDETEELEEIVESHCDLKFSGGGNGCSIPGEMALGHHEFEKLYGEIIRNSTSVNHVN